MPGETEGFSPRLVDSLVDALVVIDDNGRMLYANPALGRLLGWDVRELFGQPFVDFLPERVRDGYAELFQDWMDADPPPRSPGPTRIAMLRVDGAEVPVDVGTFLVAPARGPRLVVAALWDAKLRLDPEHYQQVADDLMEFLAGASGRPDEVVPHLLEIIATRLEFECAVAWRWDEPSQVLRCEHTWLDDRSPASALTEVSARMTMPAGQELAGSVVTSEEAQWHGKLGDLRSLRRYEAIVEGGLECAFVFPIRTRERLIGVIELFSTVPRRPDRALFTAVADIGSRLGEFIERLELEWQRNDLIEQLERSRKHQDFLLRANLALADAGHFQEAVLKLAEVAVPALGDICLIDVLGPEGQLTRLAARHADPGRQYLASQLINHPPDLSGDHPAARAVRTGEPQWSPVMTSDFMVSTTQTSEHFELTQRLHFSAYVSVPLIAADEVIGAVTVVSTDSDRGIGDDVLPRARDLAAQVARAIERARTADEQSGIARRLQTSLLPAPPREIPGLDIAVRYEASERSAEVGGDFYDVVPLADGRLALAIGDVEGHDIAAATLMGQLRSAMRAFLLLDPDPSLVLGRLDAFMAEQPVDRLATCALSVLDVQSGRLEVATAGHPPPIGGSPGATFAPLSIVPGPPLGLGLGPCPLHRLTCTTDSVLVFYTDGLVDVCRPGGPEPLLTLVDTIAAHADESSEKLSDRILDDQAAHQVIQDDIALLVVKRTAGHHIPGVTRTSRDPTRPPSR